MAHKIGVSGKEFIKKASASINGGNITHLLSYPLSSFSSSSNYQRNSLSSAENEVDPKFFLGSMRQQCKMGFRNLNDAVSLFHQMTRMNPLPSYFDFTVILSSMIKIKPRYPEIYSTVIHLSSHLELLGVPYNLFSLNILVNCYSCLGRVDFGFSIMGKIIKLGFHPSIVTFNTVINGLIYSNLLEEAARLFDQIVKLGFQTNLVTYGTLTKGLCRIGNYANALNLLVTMNSGFSLNKPDIIIYNTIIDSLCKDKLLPQATKLYSEMRGKGIQPDVLTYNTLVRGMCSLGRWDDAKKMLDEMLENNIDPNVETYSMLIDMCCKQGKVSAAHAILGLMTKRGKTPDIFTYNSLLVGYCLCGQMDEATELIDLMMKIGCKPNIVTYDSLLNGYCKSKKLDKALDLVQDMPLRGLAPNLVTYSTLIDALCKDNRLQIACQVIQELEAEGITPDIITYNSLFDGLCKSSRVDEAMIMLKGVSSCGVVPDIVTYNILVNGLCQAGRLDEAVDILSSLRAKGLVPDNYTYNVIINGYCKCKKLDQALGLFHDMCLRGCKPNVVTYNTLIDSLCKEKKVQHANHLIQKMRSQNLTPDVVTFNSLMDGLCKSSQIDEAMTMLKGMVSSGPVPEFYWSPFLVDFNLNHKSGKKVLVLDKLSPNSKHWPGADIMVFNSGHWWAQTGTYKRYDLLEYDGKLIEDMELELAYERGMRTWQTWVEENVDPKKTTVFFRSISTEHKSSKSDQWCYKKTQPIKDESYISYYPNSLVEIIEKVIKEKRKTHVKYLNITKLSEYRIDAHPSMYRYRDWKNLTKVYKDVLPAHADCSHWCLPGVPDTWNRLLYTSLFYDL